MYHSGGAFAKALRVPLVKRVDEVDFVDEVDTRESRPSDEGRTPPSHRALRVVGRPCQTVSPEAAKWTRNGAVWIRKIDSVHL